MNIQNLLLADLKPLEKNVRRHSDVQIEELKRSVKAFGQTRALVIDENNNILIGNGLYSALMQLGETKAYCYIMDKLSENEKKKLILADNKTFQLGADDYSVIEEFLQEIGAAGDFDIPGFDPETLSALSRDVEEITADIQSYGVLTDEEKEQKQKHREAVIQPEPTHSEELPTEQAPEQAAEAEPERVGRVFVCPSCGHEWQQ